jgi:small subunit ribosomal protein S9
MVNTNINATGRRKTAVACVNLNAFSKKSSIVVNGLSIENYFDLESWRNWVLKPLSLTDNLNKFSINCKLIGGGKSAQAQALSLGISRALEKMDNNLRGILKNNKLLTRDAREKERQKPGQKGARAKYQYGKR